MSKVPKCPKCNSSKYMHMATAMVKGKYEEYWLCTNCDKQTYEFVNLTEYNRNEVEE